jgi:cellulose synthase/poly-beta-1,6-N-acetylglucosamine synthase-like glycosyltransferase
VTPTADPLRVTVIVPVLNGRDILPRSLGALADSDLPRERWELVVVDDGSTDDSPAVAGRWADRVVRVERGPRGPGHARNRGSEVAKGDVLLFVDADVVVHRDTLSRVVEAFEGDPGLSALFGAYDDAPAHPSFLSQYRNLLHRYVHLRGAGEAETFWAGCGAVRTEAFIGVGGFDADAFPRPQIEDIELGYRLRDAGHRIEIHPEVQGKHLKRWSFGGMVRTDLLDRAIPWTSLMLERDAPGRETRTLNVTPLEKIKTGLAGVALLFGAVGLVAADLRWLAAAAATLLTVVVLNAPVYRWFADRRGWMFAFRVVPFHLLYHFLSGLAVVVGWSRHVLRPRRRAARDPSSLPSKPVPARPGEPGDGEP